jgi:hypothetical protein
MQRTLFRSVRLPTLARMPTRNASSRSSLTMAPPLSQQHESPTPIVFTHGPWCTTTSFSLDNERSPQYSLVQQLRHAGFSVGHLCLPGYGTAQSLPSQWTIDDLVNDIHNCFAPFARGPLVVAPSHSVRIFTMLTRFVFGHNWLCVCSLS